MYSKIWLYFAFFIVHIVYFSVSFQQKVLIISFDGFRYDYLDMAHKANANISAFKKVYKNGFYAAAVDNVFITKTFPSHYTIATGMYEESHGIINNQFFIKSLNLSFDYSKATDPRVFDVGGEPMWITNERHNQKSGVIYWFGGDAPIHKMLPSYTYGPYTEKTPLKDRFERALEWFTSKNVTLVNLYHLEPDKTGHVTGPNNIAIIKAIEEINAELEIFLAKVNNYPDLEATLNIIITSDHGMAEVNSSNVIIMDNIINSTDYNGLMISDTIWGIEPKNGLSLEDLYIKIVSTHTAHITVLKKVNLPFKFHYQSDRVPPLLIYTDLGYVLSKSPPIYLPNIWGTHGYDPAYAEMNPIFMASGPGIRNDLTNLDAKLTDINTVPETKRTKRIRMVDIYPLVCWLLGLDRPNNNNGSLANVMFMLNETSNPFNKSETPSKTTSVPTTWTPSSSTTRAQPLLGLMLLLAMLLSLVHLHHLLPQTGQAPFCCLRPMRTIFLHYRRHKHGADCVECRIDWR